MYVVDAELVVADSQRTDTGHVHKIQTGVDDGGWKQRPGGAGLGDGSGLGRQEAWKAVDGTGDDVWVRCEWWFAFSGVPVFQPVLCRCWLGWCWCCIEVWLHSAEAAAAAQGTAEMERREAQAAGGKKVRNTEHPGPWNWNWTKRSRANPTPSPPLTTSQRPPHIYPCSPLAAP